MEDGCFTLAAPLEDGDVQEMSIRSDFEKCDLKRQTKALEQLINKMMHGEMFISIHTAASGESSLPQQ